MSRFARRTVAFVVTAVIVSGSAMPAQAQSFPSPHMNVISANPFGLLIELFNGEYERVVSESATAGFGGSYFGKGDFDYVNADVFFRFYPTGRPLDGWAFGAKLGLTDISDVGTYFGYGFDANRSWLLGRNENFYVGVGFGLKRLVGVSDADDPTGEVWKFIPTFRLVNIGIAF